MSQPAPPDASPNPARDRLILGAVTVLSVAGCGSGIAQRVMDPLLPLLSAEFGRPLAQVSWVITCFSLGYAFSQLFFGPLGDRFGKLRVVTWGCLACSGAAALCALAPGLNTLLVARVLSGAMSAALIPLSMAWIGDAVPYERRQPILARFSIGQILGVALGQLLGGLSADHFGRRAPFLLLTVLFAASTVLLQRMRGRLDEVSTPGRTTGSATLGSLLREFSMVLRTPWARVVMLSVFLEGAFVLGAFAFFATHLHTTLDISLTSAGATAMLFGLGGLLFALTSRPLLARLGELGLIRGGGLALLLMMGIVALVPHLAVVAPACLAMGLGFYMLHNTLQTNATQMAPERRGAAVAAFALSYFLGQALGVSAAGWAVSHVGTPWAILAAGGGVFLTALNFSRARQAEVARVRAHRAA